MAWNRSWSGLLQFCSVKILRSGERPSLLSPPEDADRHRLAEICLIRPLALRQAGR